MSSAGLHGPIHCVKRGQESLARSSRIKPNAVNRARWRAGILWRLLSVHRRKNLVLSLKGCPTENCRHEVRGSPTQLLLSAAHMKRALGGWKQHFQAQAL